MNPSAELKQLDAEAWLEGRLWRFGARLRIFEGLTTAETRRQAIREAIKERHLEAVVCGSRERSPSTFAQAFERLFREPL